MLTQVAKNQFGFATAILWHYSFEITLKMYLYGKYSTQAMIFWSLCAFIWFRNMKKMLLQMTSGFLQLESTLPLK
jgi:transposase